MPMSENGHGNYYNKSNKGCDRVMFIILWGHRYGRNILSHSQRTLREKKQGYDPKKHI